MSEGRVVLSKGLGWLSIGLGLAQLTIPRQLAKLIGIDAGISTMRTSGIRELSTGLGILLQPRQPAWVLARVGGDLIDLGLLSTALGGARDKGRTSAALAAVAGVTALDILCSVWLLRSKDGCGRELVVRKAITINKSPSEVYNRWRNFEEFPLFMSHVRQVKQTGVGTTHWVVKGPAGTSLEWDAEIIEDKPGVSIAWRSLPGADVDNAGNIRFEKATGDRGTIVRAELHYHPPADRFGAKIAKLLGQAPEKQLRVDLMRFKQLIETGEIARTEGQAAGRKTSTSRRFDTPVRA